MVNTNIIANALNLIVLTAALSVYNSSVYSNSRMLYGLAEQGNAPRFLTKLNRNHSPINAILTSACLVAVCIVINKIMPEKALGVLMSLVVSSLVINWTMISLTHVFFRNHIARRGEKTIFPTIFYPFSNYVCIVFLLGVMAMMWFTGLKISVELIPIWLGLLYVGFRVMDKRRH